MSQKTIWNLRSPPSDSTERNTEERRRGGVDGRGCFRCKGLVAKVGNQRRFAVIGDEVDDHSDEQEDQHTAPDDEGHEVARGLRERGVIGGL